MLASNNGTFTFSIYDYDVGGEVHREETVLSSDIVDSVRSILYGFDAYDVPYPDSSEEEKQKVQQDMAFFDVPSIMNQLHNFNFRGGLMPFVLILPGRHRKITIEMKEF